MLKKMMVLAVSVAALFAVAAPAASANWTHSGTAIPSGTNPSIAFTGTVGFDSANGNVHCPEGVATIQATGGTTDGHVTAFGIENVANCHVTGSLAFIAGGTNSLVSTALTGVPTVTYKSGSKVLHISEISLHNTYKSGLKLTLTSTGEGITATVDSETAITDATLSGKLDNSLGGEVTVTGTLNVLSPNSGTYGLK